MAKSKVEWK